MKNSEDFVKGLVVAVQQGTSKGLIKYHKSPPGRKISQNQRKLADWLNGLDPGELEMAEFISATGVDAGIFGVLCVFDGVKAIEGTGPKGTFKVVYESPQGEISVINRDSDELMHDIYRGLVPPIKMND